MRNQTILSIVLTAFFLSAGPLAKAGPEYSEDGTELKFPEGFVEWIFVGTNLAIAYDTPEAPDPENKFRNAYISPEAFKALKKDGEFPEGTMLLLDVYEVGDREDNPDDPIKQGQFENKRDRFEVAVKNSKRPDKTETSTKEWAYYIFKEDQKTAKAFADKRCYDCHKAHAGYDNVWVQFYPIIRDLVPKD